MSLTKQGSSLHNTVHVNTIMGHDQLRWRRRSELHRSKKVGL